jgi:hypothetical protein
MAKATQTAFAQKFKAHSDLNARFGVALSLLLAVYIVRNSKD